MPIACKTAFVTSTSATKATQDGNGKVIADTTKHTVDHELYNPENLCDLTAKQEITNQELEDLRLEHERLKIDYGKLKQENKNYITEINSLTSRNNTLDVKLRKAESDLASKNTAYRTLQSKYDKISSQLRIMENKYYSTKEGKKELKR